MHSPFRFSRYFKAAVKNMLKKLKESAFKGLMENEKTIIQQIVALTTFIRLCTGGPSQCDNARKIKEYRSEMKKENYLYSQMI